MNLIEPDQAASINISDQLQNYMKMLQFFDDNIEDYLYIYDLSEDRIYFTEKIQKWLPLPLRADNSILFCEWNEIVYPRDRQIMEYHRQRLITGEAKYFDIVYRVLDCEGNKVWINAKGTLRKKDDNGSLLVGRVSEMALGHMVDRLTGLCSAEKFMVDLKQHLEFDDGYLMVLGVDDFKNINIMQGRAAGDAVLKQIAGVLEQHSEYPLSHYRLNSDCFAVIFPNKQQADVVDFYQVIKKEMQRTCTISAGIVSYQHQDNIDSGSLYQYAENALDQAKREGKNTLVFFSKNNYQKDLEQFELLEELKDAIQHGYAGFSLCYQPQINKQNFEIHGVEALLRYESPSRGNVSPAEIIPLLEKSGLICLVGEWVLKTALAQCKEWRREIPDLRISVNLSYVQLQQEGIVDMVLDCLEAVKMPGEALMLEVTESIQLQDYIYLNRIFYAWKQHGIKIAIDDFGTGYSSLSYLKSIEIDEVKIDRCFVDHVQYNAYNYSLLKNIIELAHSVKINVCCEGVEMFEELLALQELNSDLYQGYLFAKPYTKEHFEQAYIYTESNAYQDRISKESYLRNMNRDERRESLEVLRKEEIGNITESMEEIIYVSDLDTYEMYYLNAAGRRMTGVYDYKGRKCYEVLHGRTLPCEFCTNHQLCENKFHVWENENTYLKKNYILKDKLIRWQGKVVRLEMAIDITEHEMVSKTLQKRLDFERAIVDSCRILASEASPEQIAYNVVRVIGEFCQGQRAYILKRNRSNTAYELNSEWCAVGVPSIKDTFPMAIEAFPGGDSHTRISAQIIRGNQEIGLVAVEHPRYKEDGDDLVKTMAYFLGYSMIGEENQQKLNHLLEDRYIAIRNHTNLGLWEIRIDPNAGIFQLYPDHVLCRIMEMEEDLPPQESYTHWYSRIKDGYNEYVNHSIERMIQTGKITFLEYPWNSPTKGEVLVQCVGIRREDCDGMICLEGYHWSISD